MFRAQWQMYCENGILRSIKQKARLAVLGDWPPVSADDSLSHLNTNTNWPHLRLNCTSKKRVILRRELCESPFAMMPASQLHARLGPTGVKWQTRCRADLLHILSPRASV
ncbi:hypothetical protein NX059_010946 [Plenodomus lindquistii]|nr:hypothetical protein NX059_010946 [Plenodomus lindquistii]